MAWKLTDGLSNLRSQVNERWPNRDKASDGTIGDAAHQAETSGHNPDDTSGSTPEWDGDSDSTAEVRAWDMDSDLRESGTTAQMIVDHIRSLPNISSVLRYMIYNHKIYRASAGWASAAYTGASAHTEHIHFSGAYSQAADNNTSFNYRLEEVGNPVDENSIAAKIAADANAAPASGNLSWGVRRSVFGYPTGQSADGASYLNDFGALFTMVKDLKAAVTGLGTAVAGVDEAVIAQLGDPSTPDEEVAAALVSLLGARKDAVLALMQ